MVSTHKPKKKKDEKQMIYSWTALSRHTNYAEESNAGEARMQTIPAKICESANIGESRGILTRSPNRGIATTGVSNNA
jgi:hypothetical protein